MGWRRAVIAIVVLALGCGGPTSPSQPPPQPATFTITGNPAGASGATWTYQAVVNGVTFDLRGILFKPAGNGPFGAVIVSHGTGGNVDVYPRSLAQRMVGWGLVVIATNYTHAGGVPIGSPGSPNEIGASPANIARARQMVELLRSLGYVDMNRLAAHGHSGGAYITTGVVAAYPDLFRVASHTAGGARLDTAPSGAVPTASQASAIRAPYQLHHGDRDDSVPLAADQLLASILLAQGVPHELHVYLGAGHNIGLNDVMLARVRAWYISKGM